MASFTGMTVQITLKQPPNTIVHGKVREVIAGQTLTLQDVFFPSTDTRWETWTVQGTVIADLQVIDTNAVPAATPTPSTAIRTKAPEYPNINTNVPPTTAPTQTRTPNQSALQHQTPGFVDPAILSYGKSPVRLQTVPRPIQTPVEAPATPIKATLKKGPELLPTNGTASNARHGNDHTVGDASHSAEAANATPKQARNVRQAEGVVQQRVPAADCVTQEQGEAANRKKVRRGQKKKATPPETTPLEPPTIMNIEVSRNGNDMNGSVKRGKGWRNTPLLQPSPHTAGAGESAPSTKENRRQREANKEMQQNGWATEDATDVQDMGDFDFEASNKLFDKKGVFDQLRQDDTTADEDRLVSHNKVARPGTYGGKNLHPLENVLSPKLEPKHSSNNNEVDSTSDADTELNFANGRSSSRHSLTRVSIAKKQPSRQSSTHVDGKPHPLISDRGLSRSATSFATRSGRPAPSMSASSPRPDRGHSPLSAASASKSAIPQGRAGQGPAFMILPTQATCPVLHPHALETLEIETVSRFGLTHDAITESAARCVAEVAMTMFDNASTSRRGSRANTMRGSMTSSMLLNSVGPPVIVILAGNHSIGARAVAAVRHFICRKTEIIVAEALYESTATQDPQMRTQTAMLKRMMKGGANIKRGAWRKASNYIKNLTGPPAVIIDALLAGATYESLLGPNAQHAADTQKEAREMIDWANRSRAPVLSIGCPSGVSGTNGSATLVEGEPLAVRPDKILSLGAPMQGLLEGLSNGEKWDVSLADIGINITLRSDEAVEFGRQWVTELKFVEDDGAAGENGQ